MQATRPGRVQSAINVTPLVDVVLVLLIIFMVIAPTLSAGPGLELPETERPQDRAEDGEQILVAIEQDGTLWVENQRVASEHFLESIREAASGRGNLQVVIEGDARISFGEVRRAMLAVESAGFTDVALITQKRQEPGEEN